MLCNIKPVPITNLITTFLPKFQGGPDPRSPPLDPPLLQHSVFLTPSPTNTGYTQCLLHSLSNQYRLQHSVFLTPSPTNTGYSTVSSSLPLQPIQVTAQCLPHSLSNQYRLQHSVFLTPSPTNTGYSTVSSSLPLQPIQVTAQCLPHSLSNQYRLQQCLNPSIFRCNMPGNNL